MKPSPTTGGEVLPIFNTRKSCALRGGFSLVELSVCVMLVALMCGFSVEAFETAQQVDCALRTQTAMTEINTALERYTQRYGRLPLPASRSTSTSAPLYGHEVATGTDTSIHRVAGVKPVLIGALPHGTLRMQTEWAADCWGNKFTYAVTESLTSTTGYALTTNTGGITLREGTPLSYTTATSQAAYVVLSHGASALGASPLSYSGPLRTCDSEAMDAAIWRTDKQNCDTQDAVYYTSAVPSAATDRTTPQFNDDMLVMAERAPALPANCTAGTVNWGIGCEAPALVTLAGLSVNVTNVRAGFTGVALSSCFNGTRTTLGVCLPSL
ncbi:MAG: hypothetical protein DI582_00655 [Azospirillum brasilense]|nr:MAG: hypothetical protein DI582_00655 [Azospirillum brasilense]